ncbi:MAG: hypothetical protein B7X47_07750 [Ferrovum sp. 34-44-207]|nr:MAG: hypothetical protein B7X47_07750 [Ferrovum sp. 34-44-207]
MNTTSFKVLGILFTFTGALLAMFIGATPYFVHHHITTLTIAILLGMVLGNVISASSIHSVHWGIDFSKSQLLKIGIILYGLKVTFSEIAEVGVSGILTDMIMIICTFSLAYWVGKKWLKEDLQTVILIGAGSSICGAAAILATEPVIKAQAHKVSIAIATVVVFGTLSMFAEPLLFQFSGMSQHLAGTYLGSTIHEVAQVVVAGRSISEHTSHLAVTEKMLRVMMLPFFLIIISVVMRKKIPHTGHATQITIPWFAILFLLLTLILIHGGIYMDDFFLAAAMFALGLRTHRSAIRQAGIKPVILASILFVFLTAGGLVVNLLVDQVIN